MAAAAAASSQVKQLGEILKKQQEPFILETYLVERGAFFNRKHCNLQRGEKEASFGCFNGRRKKGVHNLVRFLFNQMASIKNVRSKRGESSESEAERISCDGSSTTLNWGSESDDVEEKEEERESCSSASVSNKSKCISFADSSHQNLEFCNPNEEKVSSFSVSFCSLHSVFFLFYSAELQQINGVTLQWECMEDQQQQLSPDSVLQGFASSSSPPPTHNRNVSSLSSGNKSSEQTRQLLFDCIAQVVEMSQLHHHHGSKRKLLSCANETVLLSRSTWSWRKGKTFHESIDEWSDDEQRREIGLQIEDEIFQQIMDKIILDLIGNWHS
ncbi:hypothetical protein LINPERPRIM_LOCUS15454 [Linum perenne]